MKYVNINYENCALKFKLFALFLIRKNYYIVVPLPNYIDYKYEEHSVLDIKFLAILVNFCIESYCKSYVRVRLASSNAIFTIKLIFFIMLYFLRIK